MLEKQPHPQCEILKAIADNSALANRLEVRDQGWRKAEPSELFTAPNASYRIAKYSLTNDKYYLIRFDWNGRGVEEVGQYDRELDLFALTEFCVPLDQAEVLKECCFSDLPEAPGHV